MNHTSGGEGEDAKAEGERIKFLFLGYWKGAVR